MKYAISLLCLLGSMLSAYPQSTVIYRNDHSIDYITEPVTLSHDLGDIIALCVGDKKIPLDAIDSIALRTVDVPTLYIVTPDDPNMTDLTDKDKYVTAEVSVSGHGYIDDMPPTTAQIKGRGNSTWGYVKKPYRVKFDKKQSIGVFPKMKNYVLLANFVDPTKIKNAVAHRLSQLLGMEYTTPTMPCQVFFNGILKGLYLMTQKVGISNEYVNIDENKGILFELSIEFDETYKFHSNLYNLPVMVKDPDFDELAEEDATMTPGQRLELWQKDFNEAEDLVSRGRGFEAFDMNSFVDYLLLNEFVGNDEIGHPKSVYIYKEAIGSEAKYKFGPVWDFDSSFNLLRIEDGEINYEARHPEGDLWKNSLFGELSSDDGFQEAYRKRVSYFVEETYPRLLEYMNTVSRFIEPAAMADGMLYDDEDGIWIYIPSSFDRNQHLQRMRSWMDRRVEYLKKKYL